MLRSIQRISNNLKISIVKIVYRNKCSCCDITMNEKGHKEDTVLVEKDENITLIGLNRPKYRNSINLFMANQLKRAFSDFEKDKNSSVAVLYGLGGNFCAGYDIDSLQKLLNERQCFTICENFKDFVKLTHCHLSKPVICGINGYCSAQGLELSLMCDLRVMEDTAILGFFGRSMGFPMFNGGSMRLPILIGQSRALDLLLTGRRVCAQEALEMGLIHRVVATGSALGQAVHLAFSIAKYPQTSLLYDRNVLYSNFNKRRFTQKSKLPINIQKEMQKCFQRFVKPDGIDFKSASWGFKDQLTSSWELEEIALENAHITKNNENS